MSPEKPHAITHGDIVLFQQMEREVVALGYYDEIRIGVYLKGVGKVPLRDVTLVKAAVVEKKSPVTKKKR